MCADRQNPYSPTAESVEEELPRFRWHLIPGAMFYVLGIASTLVGLFAVGVMIYVLATQQAGETILGMILGCAMYFAVGILWIVAGRYYWTRRFLRGLVATALGLLVPVVFIAVLGI